jgi:DNA-binding MarR family transcriptional regulator
VRRLIDQWADALPGVDTTPIEIGGRLQHSLNLIRQATEDVLKSFGLTRADFEVLSALRRRGGTLTPSGITRETLSSAAATTKRIARLESVGLVSRQSDVRDGRVAHLALTEAGTKRVDEALPALLDVERELLGVLSGEQQAQLTALLNILVEGVEAHTFR